MAARIGSATLLSAALAGLSLEGYSRSRLAPMPSTRSRANDTPVLDHVAGGGPYGGRVTSLAVARTQPATAFVSLMGGGVYRSTDLGETWQPADRGLPASIGCDLTADPVDAGTLYAACIEGLFKTVDAGGSWRQLDVDHPDAPVVAAADPRVLYDGALRSRDGGRRWAMAASNHASLCHDGTLIVDASDAESLFCVTEDGLMSSRSGGDRWTRVPSPAGVDLSSLLAVPGAADRLLASTDDGDVYAITNRGATWTPLGRVPGGSVDDLRSDDSGTVVYAKQGDGLVRSADGGRTWHALPVAWSQVGLWTYALDPRDPQVVYVGTWDGPFVSLDGGYTWQLRVRGLTRAAATIVVHEGARSVLFAAAGIDVLTSDDGGTTWAGVHDSAFPDRVEARSLASDGVGGVILRAGSRAFRLKAGATAWVDHVRPDDVEQRPGAATPFHYSPDGGTTWQTVSSPSGVVPSAVAQVGRDPRHLVAAIGGLPALVGGSRSSLWRSVDGGGTWVLTLAPPVGPVAHCCALLRDPNETDTLYAVLTGMVVGGGGAEVLRSDDAGVTWTPAGWLTSDVAVVPTRPTTLLGQHYQLGLVRSADRGATWTASTPGLPDDVDVTNFAFDRRRPTTIFAATGSRGIYRSEDGGVSWTPTGHATRP
jgi:photosystem II stability/assembly factor-like uncharacterized protein